ncbi:MAG: HAD-IIIA family hydrolase [Candidatus Omnitrophica bacterium]|nr:HAD-IIIA family hydrolase [Candidatus Omnitrophota bacterium]
MPKKFVFIDRDGVINKDGGSSARGYITRWKDFIFLPKALAALKKLAGKGYSAVIISNQQGVGKGIYTERELKKITEKMKQRIEKKGGRVAGIYYCTHRKEENCACRKPKIGLIVKAKKRLRIGSFKGKFIIGDAERDVETGKRAGLRSILVLTGNSTRKDAANWKCKPDHICKDLMEAVNIVLADEQERPIRKTQK